MSESATSAPASALTYTNRKGQTYGLYSVTTKNGRTRYVFARTSTGTPVSTIPDGFEIAESINGVVSLRKIGSTGTTAAEGEVVRAALAEHMDLRCYRVESRKNELIVFQPLGGLGMDFSGRPGNTPRFIETLTRWTRFDPVLRFVLVDLGNRTFSVDRMCYRGGFEGWRSLHDHGALADLARRYVRHLGQESFYELC